MSKVINQTKTFQIRAVATPADSEMFLDVPAHVYANDSNWVPPLRSDIAKQLAPTNPFFEYGKLQAFIALEEGEKNSQAVGRIVAAVNQRLIEREGQNVGLFGFLNAFQSWRSPNLS